MVAPNADGFDLVEQANRFLNPLAHLENVTQDHEAVCPLLLQHGDGLTQLLRLFVDVSQ